MFPSCRIHLGGSIYFLPVQSDGFYNLFYSTLIITCTHLEVLQMDTSKKRCIHPKIRQDLTLRLPMKL